MNRSNTPRPNSSQLVPQVCPCGQRVPQLRIAPHSASRGHRTSCWWPRNLHKSYRKAKITIPVLRGIDFTANRGQFTAIVGQSGSGKSTLLHVLATLDAPDEGEVHFGDQRIDNVHGPQAGSHPQSADSA